MYLVGDLFARLYTASNVNKSFIKVRRSSVVLSLLQVCYRLGYVQSFCIINDFFIKVNLKYVNSKPVFSHYKLFSTPGHRVYITLRQVRILNRTARGFFLCSTSYGIFTTMECEMYGVGGELLVNI